VLFTANPTIGSYESASVVVQKLPGGPRKVVATGGYFGRYLPSGHLVYLHEGTLFAVPFDLARLEARGAPVPVLEEVLGSPLTAAGQFAFSRQGTLAYLRGRALRGTLSIQWLDGSGRLAPLRAAPGHYRSLQLSPDGKRLAMQVFDGRTADIWICDWGRDTMSRLTFDVAGITTPVWSPDGRVVAYGAAKGSEPSHLYWVPADGTGSPQALTTGGDYQNPTSWHPSGRYLAFNEVRPDTGNDVMILPIEGDARSGLKPGQPTTFLGGPYDETEAAFSPDGRWVAYASNESGRYEVYVRPFPGPGGKWPISTEGGFFPTWSRKGRELFYEAPDRKLMVASYAEQGGSFVTQKPRPWCEAPITTLQDVRGFDLHPDGRRFAVVQEVRDPGDESLSRIVLFLNFFDELRRLAPAR
jgi:serine/threonine-protein kinase